MKRAYIFALGLVVFARFPASATIINVPDDYPMIQQGIDASTDGDTVLVQPGTYVENINFNRHNIVLGSLFLTTGDTAYISSTIIDGDDVSSVVKFEGGEDSTAVLIGLTIRNGFSMLGGGIFCDSSGPVICDNAIVENNSTDSGGGLYFSNNSSPRIINNVIMTNYSDHGGGFYCENSNSSVQYNIIADNTARQGGGFNCGPEANLTIKDNIIKGNIATGPNFSGYGGGVFVHNCHNLTVINNEISQNSAIGRGGGIYLQNSNSNFIGNTIVDNIAYFGKAIYCLESSPVLINSIIWGFSGSHIYLSGNSFPQISYCDINGIWEGEGNIRLNPLFVDRENNDYNVCAGSPCIDSGDPGLLDPDGTRSDIGVFYSDHPQCPQGGNRWYVSTAGNDTTGDGSEQNPFRTIQHGIDISVSGDSIVVLEGTYIENVNYNGYNIVLGSLFLTTGDTSYISTTIIDGNNNTAVILAYGENENAVITGFTIQNGEYGINIYNSNPTISHNLIKDNIGSGEFPFVAEGGGISCAFSDAVITFNRIIGNGAIGDLATGIGIFCRQSTATIANNIIMQTFGSGWDQFVYGLYATGDSNPCLKNNVIVHNNSEYGGGIGGYQSTYLSINNIIRNNSPWNVSGPPIVIYCNVQGGWEGEGNIDVDPLFRDPENGDYHLMSTACGDPYDSPCIDAGHPDILDSLQDCSWGLGELRSDMGAYGGGDSVTVGIDYRDIPIPQMFSLSQNYPNPFNAMTVIRYSLPEPADVKIEIFDILGRRVETLLAKEQPAGYHQIIWNAGKRSSGMYFYRIQAGEYSDTKKMVLLK